MNIHKKHVVVVVRAKIINYCACSHRHSFFLYSLIKIRYFWSVTMLLTSLCTITNFNLMPNNVFKMIKVLMNGGTSCEVFSYTVNLTLLTNKNIFFLKINIFFFAQQLYILMFVNLTDADANSTEMKNVFQTKIRS